MCETPVNYIIIIQMNISQSIARTSLIFTDSNWRFPSLSLRKQSLQSLISLLNAMAQTIYVDFFVFSRRNWDLYNLWCFNFSHQCWKDSTSPWLFNLLICDCKLRNSRKMGTIFRLSELWDRLGRQAVSSYDWSMAFKGTINQSYLKLVNPNEPSNRCAESLYPFYLQFLEWETVSQ